MALKTLGKKHWDNNHGKTMDKKTMGIKLALIFFDI